MNNKNLTVTVFGCGYVGLPLAVALAEMGYQVMGVDTHKTKITLLCQGKAPFFEPQLAQLLTKNFKKGALVFSDSLTKGAQHGSILINTVAAPSHRNITATLEATKEVLEACARSVIKPFIFFNRSTMPIGSNEILSDFFEQEKKRHKNSQPFLFIAYPEFLRQGNSLEDVLKPQRIILGVDGKKISLDSLTADLKKHNDVFPLFQKFFKLFRFKKTPFMITSFRNAEMIKYASNAFLATKISFANELARLCENLSVSVDTVVEGMGLDRRIGKDFFRSGLGFGGSCLPKDLTNLIDIAVKAKHQPQLLEAVEKINQTQPEYYGSLLKKHFPLKGKKIALWGVSFKPNTDDLRDAPALKLMQYLHQEGAKLHVYDPVVTAKHRNVAFKIPSELKFCKPESDMYKVLAKADALIVVTEWIQFARPDFKKMHRLMRQPVVLDGRGVWNSKLMSKNGFTYYRLGNS